MRKTVITILLLLVLARPVSAQILQPTTATITTNGDAVCWNVDKTMSAIAVRVYGTWTGTLTPFVRMGATTNITPPSNTISASTMTANGIMTFQNEGWQRVCLVATAAMTGTVQFTAVAGGGNSATVFSSILTALTDAAAQDVAHDAVDSGNPVKIGGKAISLSTNPTDVAASDRTNAYFTRAGQLITIGGHPNIVTKVATITDADGAQTGTSLATVSAGTKVVIVAYGVKCSNANTVNVDFTLAFDTDATFTAASTTGVTGHIDGMDDIPPGGGFAVGNGGGILGVGADDEDLRYSLSDPVTGSCTVTVKYFTISG
jgi:hypothetical protein